MKESLRFEQYSEKHASSICDLWNEEVGFIFKLDSDVFHQHVDESKYLFLDGSLVVMDGKTVVAFLIAKIYDNDEIIQKYLQKGWISLLYVKRDYRRCGIGDYMVRHCENKLFEKGVKSISVGADMDNFFPGIPADFDNLTDVFFKKRGYKVSYYTHDLVKKITKEDLKTIKKDGIVFRYCINDDKEELLSFMKDNFYGRWYYECLEYFKDGKIEKEYLLAIQKEAEEKRIVGFLRVNNQLIRKVSYNITWRNNFKKLVGFGPLGVNVDFRHRGIASSLILWALSDAYKSGYSHALIDWTGLVSYYQRFGFQVWKLYCYCQKEL